MRGGETVEWSARSGVARIARPAAFVFLGALPVLAVVALFVDTIRTDAVAFDFRIYYDAAEAVLRGDSIYPPADDPTLLDGRAYQVPPVTALAVVPLTMLGEDTARLVAMALLLVVALAIPLVLGVRDWRCFGLMLLWPPVLSAIQTANVTIVLAFAAALAWRFRERPRASGLAVGTAVAIKLLLWPLGIWMAATRRWSALAWGTASASLLMLASWAIVRFDGLRGYPALLRRVSDVMDDRGYTVHSLALEAGASARLASVLWVVVAGLLLAGVVALGRAGDDRRAFLLAIAASLACTPVVWLHYFALLVVVVAVAQPRLGLAWFVPLAMYLTPGSGDPTVFETTVTVAAAAVTVAVAFRASRPVHRPDRGRAWSQPRASARDTTGATGPSAEPEVAA